MQRLFGILLLLCAAVAASELGFIAARLSADDYGAGVRAIIVEGALVERPIVIVDFDVATALHDEVTRALKHTRPVPPRLLKDRPCLRMAVFFTASDNARIPLAQLKSDHADARWTFYPAVGDHPAVIAGTAVSQPQLTALAGYGVPVSVVVGPPDQAQLVCYGASSH
jgi:hypothetical protein